MSRWTDWEAAHRGRSAADRQRVVAGAVGVTTGPRGVARGNGSSVGMPRRQALLEALTGRANRNAIVAGYNLGPAIEAAEVAADQAAARQPAPAADALDLAWEATFYGALASGRRWGCVKAHGEIDAGMARRFVAELAAAAARHDRVVVWFDSGGGLLGPTVEMAAAIQDAQGRGVVVEAFVDYAASAATLLVGRCRPRLIDGAGVMLVHDGSGVDPGVLARLDAEVADWYAARAGGDRWSPGWGQPGTFHHPGTPGWWAEAMDAETEFHGLDAVRVGLVDAVGLPQP